MVQTDGESPLCFLWKGTLLDKTDENPVAKERKTTEPIPQQVKERTCLKSNILYKIKQKSTVYP